MPIYGDKLIRSQYEVVKTISVTEFRSLRSIWRSALNTFPYKDKISFLKTIQRSEADKAVSWYKYKAKIDILFDQNYRNNLKGKFPYMAQYYNDPKQCIDDYNYIVMMESLIKQANKLLPKTSKYLFDIYGSWTNGKVILMKKK